MALPLVGSLGSLGGGGGALGAVGGVGAGALIASKVDMTKNPSVLVSATMVSALNDIYNSLSNIRLDTLVNNDNTTTPSIPNFAIPTQKITGAINSLQQNAKEQLQKSSALKAQTNAIANIITSSSATTLPEVLSKNALAITSAINANTVSLSEQISLLNNYMLGLMVYLEQFLNLEIDKLSISTATSQIEADRRAKEIEKEQEQTKPFVPPIANDKIFEGAKKTGTSTYWVDAEGKLIYDKSQIAALAKPNQGELVKKEESTTPVASSSEYLKYLVPISEALKTQSTLQSDIIPLQKEKLALQKEVLPLQKESLEYNKTSVAVRDLEGHIISTASPRELELTKNATVAKDVTDKINFELDDEFFIPDGFDITKIFGYEKSSDIVKEMIEKMGGN